MNFVKRIVTFQRGEWSGMGYSWHSTAIGKELERQGAAHDESGLQLHSTRKTIIILRSSTQPH